MHKLQSGGGRMIAIYDNKQSKPRHKHTRLQYLVKAPFNHSLHVHNYTRNHLAILIHS